MNFRISAKRAVQALALALALVPALLSAFGRLAPIWEFFAHIVALIPGIPGNFVRSAFYKLTLEDCSIDTVIGFGTYFSRPYSRVGPNVSIGSYCVLSQVAIGPRTQVASHVEMPAKNQHTRDHAGRISSSDYKAADTIAIGSDCWIGASAVVMANVGEGSIVGAGSVVVKDVPPNVLAVGVPAMPIKTYAGPDIPGRSV